MVKVTAIRINMAYIKITMFLLVGVCFVMLSFNSIGSIQNIVRNINSDFFVLTFENTLTLNKIGIKNTNKTFRVTETLNNTLKYLIDFDINEPESIFEVQIKLLENTEDFEDMMLVAESSIYFEENIEEYSKTSNILDNPMLNGEPQIKPIEDIIKTKGIKLINETKYEIDIQSYTKKPLDLGIKKSTPKVLIYHTHSCESYTPSKKYNYVPSDNDRTTDLKYTVVKVGEELSKILKKKYGIKVVHDKTVHDRDAYNRAYSKSANTVQKYLKKDPEYSLIIDIHRDAMNINGEKLRTSTVIGDKSAARVMVIVGTDSRGLPHPNWRKNLNLGIKFINKMNNLYPGLARGINLKLGRFNQYLSPNLILLEVGANGNTLDEALNCTEYMAHVIGELLK